MFLRSCWYVAAWLHELPPDRPVACQVLDEPLVLYRTPDGGVAALADRCPHRWAPLSLGRIEGDGLRCMYHGLLFDRDGRCLAAPGCDVIPRSAQVRAYPAHVRDGWVWVWMGDAASADLALIPRAFGLDDPALVMRADQIDYQANFMLINDNLCDLSHVDFVHETTLGRASGGGWSDEVPNIKRLDRGVRVERWFVGKPASPTNPTLVDTWSTYDFLAPGIFLMENKSYPHGAAQRLSFGEPTDAPMTYRVEQQAVTPISEARTRYFFATGFDARIPHRLLDGVFETVAAAFAEDRRMIEAQQRSWEGAPASTVMAFIAHDKGPAMFRRVMEQLIRDETKAAPPTIAGAR